MLIAIDIREACRDKPTGKGVWTKAVTEQLLLSSEHQFLLITDTPTTPFVSTGSVTIKTIRSRLPFGWHLAAARTAMDAGVDIFLATTSYITPLFLRTKVPFGVVVHDLIAFQPGKHDRKARLLEKICLPRIITRASVLFTTTTAVQSDITTRFNHLKRPPIIVCGAAADLTVRPPTGDEPKRSVLLHLGTLCPRKNQLGTIQAYAQLPADIRRTYQLVLAGKRGWDDDDIVRLAQVTDGVVWKSYVSTKELEDLWRSTAIFLLPSFYEGFGLPVLEAQIRGVPVVTSSSGALAEVAGSGALFADPADAASIAAAIEAILRDEHQRQQLTAAGLENAARYRWSDVAARLLKALETV